jgi:hypothetical protein
VKSFFHLAGYKAYGLFLDPVVSVGYFKDNEAFVGGNSNFPDEGAGENDSDKDNFVEGDGWDNFFILFLSYAESRKQQDEHYSLKNSADH